MLEKDIKMLTKYGNLGFYKYGKVTQIFLINKINNNLYNFFTHIEFSNKIEKEDEKYVLDKPISINSEFKIGIITFVLAIEEFIKIYLFTEEKKCWVYNGEEIDTGNLFDSGYKCVPLNDPTGSIYNKVIPLEQGLYCSNFIGNYYIHELFSDKKLINRIVTKKDIDKIQIILKDNKINYNFIYLSDRVGNIVCRFNIEVIRYKPVRLGQYGIEYTFEASEDLDRKPSYTIHIIKEHDGLIYSNILDSNFVLSKFTIEPNEYKNTVIIIDNETSLINFYLVNDFSKFSSYNSEIILGATTSFSERKIRINQDDKVFTTRVIQRGRPLPIKQKDLYISSNRKYINDIEFQKSKKYLVSYNKEEREKAVNDIRYIINNNLITDLDEICMLDPYLMPEDIIQTSLFCRKHSIKIKAVCSYKRIHGNKETKDLTESTCYESFRESSNKKLDNAMCGPTDILLEYRSVYNNYGYDFHDRYLILKFETNRSRVWSLGASYNALGKSHHIVQIVEDPQIVVELFDDLWEKTNHEECIIAKNF